MNTSDVAAILKEEKVDKEVKEYQINSKNLEDFLDIA